MCDPEISPLRILHLGLRNPDKVTCTDAACNGKLFWDSGAPFTHLAAMGSIAASGEECFLFDTVQDKVINMKCCHNAFFFCQFPF